MQEEIEKIRRVRKKHTPRLMKKANVVGVGVGYRRQAGQQTDELALVVMVSRKMPVNILSARDVIPAEIDGVPVDVQELGEIRAQA
jgi:hypothetical protein